MTTTLWIDEIDSPMGTLYVVSDGARLCALDYAGYEPRMHGSLARRFGAYALEPANDPQGFSTRLRAYLDGDLNALAALPVSATGTPFQERVWAALRDIPPGTTLSYGQLAARLGAPTASRAVGAANGRNPIAIVVPCHRVIGASAALTGYAGGVEKKRWLLAHEGIAVG